MSIGPVRPRFSHQLHASVDDSIRRVMEAAGSPDARCVPRELGHHVDLAIPPAERRLWSPSVHLEFSAGDNPETAIVHGQVGPQPATWTLFFFAFVHAGMIAGFGFMLGFVQMMLDTSAWGMWVGFGGTVCTLLIYAATQIGRRLAAPQTAHLMSIVDDAIRAIVRADTPSQRDA